MEGIYLTEGAKKQIEAKIAERLKIDRDDYYGHANLLNNILQSATIMPVEKDWRDIKDVLQKEAEYYAHNYFVMQDNHYNGLKEGFIAGVNSKYTQVEKIKAQIEVLLKIHKEYRPNISISHACLEEIKQLQQQLKDLENEK
jgi:hypothetical protein